MPRRKPHKSERILLTEGWETFGLFIRTQRIVKRLTQQQAAEAAGISKRQWIRYEMGSKVLLKRMRSIANALNLPPSRILYLAGYKISPRRNDAAERLRRMHDMLLAGSLDIALEELLFLYYRIGQNNRGLSSDLDGMTAPNFATATVLLERLPGWLLDVILKAMQERVNDKQQHDPETRYRVKHLIRKKCIEALSDIKTI
jgi:transcriptional regulator with XRE-family HTH domain